MGLSMHVAFCLFFHLLLLRLPFIPDELAPSAMVGSFLSRFRTLILLREKPRSSRTSRGKGQVAGVCGYVRQRSSPPKKKKEERNPCR
ncbi:hypothetical protein I7I50_09327 [Histoplasma capsulatum G186AR]|uniref:Secreted protein n=1 Tax=Ajellomyces capsulatus TaxID=5037 RepID=A0A8H8CZT7_AJECA|nr:hypothetical protein I7I52_06848 [Histoplasma capsulatum]QSS74237.1 hypothetical protein I7I50_09327 [Histoplasma capsulatum G186AR]